MGTNSIERSLSQDKSHKLFFSLLFFSFNFYLSLLFFLIDQKIGWKKQYAWLPACYWSFPASLNPKTGEIGERISSLGLGTNNYVLRYEMLRDVPKIRNGAVVQIRSVSFRLRLLG